MLNTTEHINVSARQQERHVNEEKKEKKAKAFLQVRDVDNEAQIEDAWGYDDTVDPSDDAASVNSQDGKDDEIVDSVAATTSLDSQEEFSDDDSEVESEELNQSEEDEQPERKDIESLVQTKHGDDEDMEEAEDTEEVE